MCVRLPGKRVCNKCLHVLGGSSGKAILKFWNAILYRYVWGDAVYTHGSPFSNVALTSADWQLPSSDCQLHTAAASSALQTGSCQVQTASSQLREVVARARLVKWAHIFCPPQKTHLRKTMHSAQLLTTRTGPATKHQCDNRLLQHLKLSIGNLGNTCNIVSPTQL